MWKRYELRRKETTHLRQDESSTKKEVLKDLDANRIVKRMRVKEASFKVGDEGDHTSTRYITTLQDNAPGTPRSWSTLFCKRSWLILDIARETCKAEKYEVANSLWS